MTRDELENWMRISASAARDVVEPWLRNEYDRLHTFSLSEAMSYCSSWERTGLWKRFHELLTEAVPEGTDAEAKIIVGLALACLEDAWDDSCAYHKSAVRIERIEAALPYAEQHIRKLRNENDYLRTQVKRLRKGEAVARRMVTPAMKRRVHKRDDWTCLRCKRRDLPLHADHVVPFSLGGACHEDNLQTLCEQCNLRKELDYRDFRSTSVITA